MYPGVEQEGKGTGRLDNSQVGRSASGNFILRSIVYAVETVIQMTLSHILFK